MKTKILTTILSLFVLATFGQNTNSYLFGVDGYAHKFYKLYLPTALETGQGDSALISVFDLPGTSTHVDGIAFDGYYLWHGDNQENKIYKLDPNNGNIEGWFFVPDHSGPDSYDDHNPYGLEWDGNYLWIVDYDNSRINVVDVNVALSDGNCDNALVNTIETIDYVYGVAIYGNDLWVSSTQGRLVLCNLDSSYLNHSTDNFILKDFFTGQNRGIAFDGNYIYHADYIKKTIVKVDIETGDILQTFTTPLTGNTAGISIPVNNTYSDLSGLAENSNIFLCGIEKPNVQITFDLSGYSNISSAFLRFGYLNFDRIVDEYPGGVTLETLNYSVLVDDNVLSNVTGVIDSTTKLQTIDVSNYITNNNLNVVFRYDGGGDELMVVKPALTIEFQNNTKIEEIKASIISSVYPNPATHLLNYSLNIRANNDITVSINNMSGKLLVLKKGLGNKGQINIDKLTPGVYLLGFYYKNKFIANQKFEVVK